MTSVYDETRSILPQLSTECFFPKTIAEYEPSDCAFPELRWKIGHLRADYDGYRWWNTAWTTHRGLESAAICREIDAVYGALTGENTLRDSGEVNMFGTAIYLQREFPELGIDSAAARRVLQAWMDSFREDTPC